MTISMQTLSDAIVAIVTTIGIAVALSIAIVVVGAFIQRSRTRTRALTSGHIAEGPAPTVMAHPTQTDNTRDLALR